MNEDTQGTKGTGLWWRPAAQVFAEITTWIAVPIILALLIGKYLDGHFQTTPWIFLGLTGLAFLASMWNIWKTVRRYANKIKNK